MPSLEDSASSPISAPALREDALAYYKSQYEQLEAELADFQASSRELEAELERDVEASEKRERRLQERVEALGFEVEEWKTKYKQSKTEASAAQASLQKEITTLRDVNRTIQLKLRDIEVANDDFERQARNTTSSLEDLDSKYNVTIERGVMLEEEMKAGEQEREELRIETQRLRDELSDLKVEAEIMQDKLRHAESVNERHHIRKVTPPNLVRPQSQSSEHSPSTSVSSPTNATPPTKSASSTISDTHTPPSPPTSDTSLNHSIISTPLHKSRLSISDSNTTPRPTQFSTRKPRQSRISSINSVNGQATPSIPRRTTLGRQEAGHLGQQPQGIPNSTSLHQIRGLIGKMQKLEQRVHSARSKLPAPISTPPRASPRSGSALGQSYIPATVTVRSHKKRAGGSNASGASSSIEIGEEPSNLVPLSTRHTSRLSVGRVPPTTSRESMSANGTMGISRPSSRTSFSSRSSTSHAGPSSNMSASRPASRQSISGARTPLGHYSSSTVSESRARPRSSLAGSYASSHGHSHSSSMNRLSSFNLEESANGEDALTPTPSRRTTLGKEGSGIPTPAGLKKRQSATALNLSRRASSRLSMGEMGPPERKATGKKLSGVGETY